MSICLPQYFCPKEQFVIALSVNLFLPVSICLSFFVSYFAPMDSLAVLT